MTMFVIGGVKEELQPIHALKTGEYILAELDACFMPFEDTLDNLIHPFRKNEPISFVFFASYEIRDNRIHSFRLAPWTQPTAIEPFRMDAAAFASSEAGQSFKIGNSFQV
ncbi:hypothetical protein CORC01_06065 [Colletotrichum orchidophilum]|uniref:Uncharacterized protein n=1 Tax=Colletotrichum orchidophilum TaxID=1209926 RepID=A0A1G4BB38_9PEZI|nr:uncharacterized protein CORC01_06065 [Colletotrichum orchidophilum]OHE98614.1 hypothetical protein CORC01_06065 [Colletotrichum orchidophilum]